MQDFLIAGSGADGVIDRLRPGTLVVVAGERSDIVLASGLVYLQGMPLAGLLLTCASKLTPQVATLLGGPGLIELPILTSDQDTYRTAELGLGSVAVRWADHCDGRSSRDARRRPVEIFLVDIQQQPCRLYTKRARGYDRGNRKRQSFWRTLMSMRCVECMVLWITARAHGLLNAEKSKRGI